MAGLVRGRGHRRGGRNSDGRTTTFGAQRPPGSIEWATCDDRRGRCCADSRQRLRCRCTDRNRLFGGWGVDRGYRSIRQRRGSAGMVRGRLPGIRARAVCRGQPIQHQHVQCAAPYRVQRTGRPGRRCRTNASPPGPIRRRWGCAHRTGGCRRRGVLVYLGQQYEDASHAERDDRAGGVDRRTAASAASAGNDRRGTCRGPRARGHDRRAPTASDRHTHGHADYDPAAGNNNGAHHNHNQHDYHHTAAATTTTTTTPTTTTTTTTPPPSTSTTPTTAAPAAPTLQMTTTYLTLPFVPVPIPIPVPQNPFRLPGQAP